MNLLIEALILTFIGLLTVAYAARMLGRQQKKYDLRLEELTLCLNDLTVRMEMKTSEEPTIKIANKSEGVIKFPEIPPVKKLTETVP